MFYPIFRKVDPGGVKISGLTMTHFEHNIYKTQWISLIQFLWLKIFMLKVQSSGPELFSQEAINAYIWK